MHAGACLLGCVLEQGLEQLRALVLAHELVLVLGHVLVLALVLGQG